MTISGMREGGETKHPDGVLSQIWITWVVLSLALAGYSAASIDWDQSPGLWQSFLLAWLIQVPLVVACAGMHGAVRGLAGLLHPPLRGATATLLAGVLVFLFLLFYFASHRMKQDLGVFLSGDLVAVAAKNLRQILPDLVRGNGGVLGLLGSLSLGVAVISGSPLHPVIRRKCSLIGIVALTVLCGGAAVSYGIVSPNRTMQDRVRYDYIPTASLVLELADRIGSRADEKLDWTDLDLERARPVSEFAAEHPLANKPHVFVVLLESVPWDRYETTGYRRTGVTPNIDRLAERCLVFPRTYSAANHSNYAQTSFHSSLYPLRRSGLDFFQTIDYPKASLYDLLGAYGYETAFFSAQNEDWQGMRRFVQKDSRFDMYYHSERTCHEAHSDEAKLPDGQVVDKALDFLSQRDPERPLCLYLNLQNTHFPYNPQPGAENPFEPWSTKDFEFGYFKYDEEKTGVVSNRFDNALHNVDRQLGRLFERLEREGLMQDSLVVVSSDHGEAFYENGFPTHGSSLFDEQIRVTTFFKLPGSETRTDREDVISLIDVPASVIEALGLPHYPGFQGEPVLAAPRSGPVYLLSHALRPARGIVDGPWKYVETDQGTRLLSAVGMGDEDPTDHSSEQPEVAARLGGLLEEFTNRQLCYYNWLPQAARRVNFAPRPPR